MKNNIACSCLLFASLLFPGLAAAGTLVTGQSIAFVEADFTDGSATKSWSINRPGVDGNGDPYGPDTLIWATSGATLGYVGGTSRLYLANATATAGSVTWKFTVPESLTITDFTWGVRQVLLTGPLSSDDSFEWQYSLDGASWTSFYERANQSASGITINNQALSQGIVGTAVHELYIRAVHIEGTDVAGDGGYWAVLSSTSANGGVTAASYIQLTVQSIPEPANAALLFGAVCLTGGICRRKMRR